MRPAIWFGVVLGSGLGALTLWTVVGGVRPVTLGLLLCVVAAIGASWLAARLESWRER